MYTSILVGRPTLYITEDQTQNVDVAEYARGDSLDLLIVVAPGVTVQANNPANGALYCSRSIVSDTSKVTVRNLGNIRGSNGAGGRGGNSAGGQKPGAPGGKGGDAIEFDCAITLFNAGGMLESGGGGGGGGGLALNFGGIDFGGSGGGGNPGGAGGIAPGYNGYAGNTAAYGSIAGGPRNYGLESQYYGGAGGSCNGPGTTGSPGETSNGSDSDVSGGAGGAPGLGVNSNGNGVTIIDGAANIIGDIG